MTYLLTSIIVPTFNNFTEVGIDKKIKGLLDRNRSGKSRGVLLAGYRNTIRPPSFSEHPLNFIKIIPFSSK